MFFRAVKSKYVNQLKVSSLSVVMHEQHYVFPANFVYFNHVFKSFKSLYNENYKFREIFQKGVLKYFKIFAKFLNISQRNISSCIPTQDRVLTIQVT